MTVYIIIGVVLYLVSSLIQFYFSLYRKHRKSTVLESVVDAFFAPGFYFVVFIAITISTLFGWNK